ncbi:uncharacterized protein MELLADRAFT_124140 [Melampsora larici-populina 98AG31]|uniref:Secreted protein n=1 Tax=Melampsora larici-populina (strain 98AG31 / pathotype 3-4-7) TaxID=747676 RepID=F4R2X6_MELLP|nr:uncharacterized protein MELLADRAFT_124140 [Melampsora larici-populina 98AG31]EGG12890.1 secreted protein [Melampsora larici-populina 98AG31]
MNHLILHSLFHFLLQIFIVQCRPVLESSLSSSTRVPKVAHLEATGPENWYPETVERVVQGRGSNIPRTEEMQERYTQYFSNVQKNHKTPEENIYKQMEWNPKLRNQENLPSFLNPQCHQRSDLVKILKNDFPWDLPKEVEHFVVWMRIPLVNKSSFQKHGKERFPSIKYFNQDRIKGLLEYIDNHPFFGYSGIHDENLIKPLNPAKELHPNGNPYKTFNNQFITQTEGWQAIQWAGRHVNAYLQKTFPQNQYEFVWNRSTKKVRSFVDPEHIHVLVKSKNID